MASTGSESISAGATDSNAAEPKSIGCELASTPVLLGLLIAAAVLVFFLNLGVPALWDEDEPRNAACAREMLQRGDWIVPTFNAKLRADKPILIYWVTISLYKLWGVSEFTARLGSALWSLGTVLMTFAVAWRLTGRKTAGFFAGLSLCTSLMFATSARAATTDATLTFWVTAALAAFVFGWKPSGNDLVSARPHRGWLAACFACLGVAVLAKGPSAVVLPTGVLGLFCLLWQHRRLTTTAGADSGSVTFFSRLKSSAQWWCGALSPVQIAVTGWRLRPVMAALLVAAIALPWYIAVGQATDGEWLRGFLGRHNVNRFLEAHEGHSGGVYYYPIAILIGFAPWSVFLPMAVVAAGRRAVNHRTTDWGNLFAVVWVSLYVLFFTAAKTKLPSYVLPAYPAVAILTGRWFADWLASPAICPAWMPRASLTAGIIGGGVASGIATVVSATILPGEWWIGVVGLPLAVGCGIALWRLMRGERAIAAQVFTAATVLFTAGFHGIVSVGVDRHQISRPFLTTAKKLRPNGDAIPVAAFDYFQSSLVFYADQPVVDCSTPDDVAAFFAANPGGVLVTRTDQYELLASVLPDDVQVLAQKRLFLRQEHDALLIGRVSETSRIQHASAVEEAETEKR